MSDKKGILIVPANKNGDTLLNVLSIFLRKDLNQVQQEEYPEIGEILFLTTKGLDMISIDGIQYEPFSAYAQMLKRLERDDVSISSTPIINSGHDIPIVIQEAVKKKEKQDYVIIDLTNGSKQITGILYTSGTLCGISNMFYVEVHKDGDWFYKLWEEKTIDDKYSIKKFDAMRELENLASLNNIEFVMYKAEVNEIRDNSKIGKILYWCDKLDKAINAYFIKDQYISCIREIGEINEELLTFLLNWVKTHKPLKKAAKNNPSIEENNKTEPAALIKDGKYGGLENRSLYLAQKEYLTSLDSVNKGNSKEDAIIVRNWYERLFKALPNLYHLVSALRIYRNQVDHPNHNSIDKEDAKLSIMIILKIIRELSQCEIVEEIFDE